MSLVYVLSKSEKPLMPCKPARARHLLRDGEAKVIRRTPFTIQLTIESTEHVQEVVVGLDPGYKTVGVAAISGDQVLYQGEVELRNDVRRRMDQRRMYRRNRRGRKTRYRQPRFDNRRRPAGWLPSSMRSKRDATVKVVRKIIEILPVSEVVVEQAKFDLHAIWSPDVESEGYQRGPQYGWANVKAYVRHRDGYRCRHCKGKSKDERLEVHHIRPRSEGGANRPENLLALCKTCHDKVTVGEITLKARPGRSLAAGAHINVLRKFVVEAVRGLGVPVRTTWGHITKTDREARGMPKTHYYDAVAIAVGQRKVQTLCGYVRGRCVPGGCYKLFTGKHSHVPNQVDREFMGFRRFDKVRIPDGREGFVWARRKTGIFTLRSSDGTMLKEITARKLYRIESASTLILENQNRRIPPRTKVRGLLRLP